MQSHTITILASPQPGSSIATGLTLEAGNDALLRWAILQDVRDRIMGSSVAPCARAAQSAGGF